jgi:flagellin
MISFNTNAAATAATYNLDRTNENLKRSLTRLSSGLRINSAFDDAGGLAVSMKLASAIRRTDAASANAGNALSFLQTQDGVLKTAGSILERMSELATLATDPIKTSDDRALYDTEFTELEEEMTGLLTEEFNGIPLFSATGSVLTLRTSENGVQTMGITQVDLQEIQNAIVVTGGGLSVASETGAAAAVTALNTQIQELAELRAANGAEQSRVSYAQDILAVNRNNLEAANSQIMDVDIAKESTEFAKRTILAQAGVAMLAQANISSEVTLRLLE